MIYIDMYEFVKEKLKNFTVPAIDTEYNEIIEDFIKYSLLYLIPLILTNYTLKQSLVTKASALHTFYILVTVLLSHFLIRSIRDLRRMD